MALTSIWLAVLGATSGLGALLDAFTRKLPNWLCIAMALAGLTFGFLLDGWTGLGLHALHGVLAFGIGFLLGGIAVALTNPGLGNAVTTLFA